MAGNNLSYSVKVCLTSAILSPGIITAVDCFLLDARYGDIWQSLKHDTLVSLALTLPILLCFYLVTRYVNGSPQFKKRRKILLAISGTFLAFAPSLVGLLYDDDYFNGFNVIDLMEPLIHALVIVIAVFAFKLIATPLKDNVYSDYKGEQAG